MNSTKTSILFSFLFFFGILVLGNLVFMKGLLDEVLLPRFIFVSGFLFIISLALLSDLRKSIKTVQLTDLMVVIFVGFHLISCLYATNFAEAFFESQKLILLGSVYFLAKFFMKNSLTTSLRAFSYSSLCYCLIICLICIPQLVEIYNNARIDRLTIRSVIGFSANKNLLSGLLLFFIPGLLIGAFHKNRMKYIFIACIILVCGLLYVLETRSVFVAIIVMCATLLYVSIASRSKKHDASYLKALFAVPVAALITFLILLFSDSLLPIARWSGFIEPASPTGTWMERIIVWSKSTSLMKENLFFGVGSGNWKLLFPLTGMDGLVKGETQGAVFARPHNDFLWLILELGFVGLASYLIIWYTFLRVLLLKIINTPKRQSKQLLAIVLAGLFGYLSFSFFSFPKERIEFLSLFAIYLAIISTSCREWIPKYSLSRLKRNSVVIIGMILMTANLAFGVHRLKFEQLSFELNRAYLNDEYKTILDLDQESPFYNVTSTGTPLSFYQGVALLTENRPQEAIEQFEKAKQINPGFLVTYTNLGVAFSKMNDHENALKSYSQALEISSHHPDTNYNLALLYYELGNREESMRHIENLKDSDARKQALISLWSQ